MYPHLLQLLLQLLPLSVYHPDLVPQDRVLFLELLVLCLVGFEDRVVAGLGGVGVVSGGGVEGGDDGSEGGRVELNGLIFTCHLNLD